MSKLACGWLTGVAVLALLVAGFFNAYPIEVFCGRERTVALDEESIPLAHRAGLSYWADLSRLKLHARATNAHGPPQLYLQFFENGVPLVNEPDHSRIEVQPGLYSHWGQHIIFSPRAGTSPTGPYSIRYLALDDSLRWLGKAADPALWWWIATVCLLGLAAAGALIRRLAAAPASLILFLALAGAIAPYIVRSWDEAQTMPDSDSYITNSARPPLYPWFIHASAGDAAWSADDFHTFGQALPGPSAALLCVVRAQRVMFWACFIVAAWAASLLLSRPLAVWFFFTLHLGGMLLPDLETCLMSEPLALAFLFLVVAAFCVLIARRRLWPLPALAAAYSCLVLTRSAGAFAIVFLGVAAAVTVIAYWQHKRTLTGVFALVGLIGFAALGALLGNSHAQNGVWALSPLHNWERIAFAVQLADDSDLDLLQDADARQFLGDALNQRLDREARTQRTDFDLNANCYGIASPLAQRLFEERFGTELAPRPDEHPPTRFQYIDGLFSRVANTVLPRHRDRYFRIVAHSFFTRAVRDCTRLHWRRASFMWLAALGFVGCLIARNRHALAGATCLAAHLANLIIMSCCELPMERYVHFSEWVFLLGLLLAALGCARRVLLALTPTSSERERQVERDPSLALRAGFAKRAIRACRKVYEFVEATFSRSLPHGRRWGVSLGLLLVLTAVIAWHALAILAQPLMLYPDSADFMGRAYRGLNGGSVWRGDHQFLPGYPYLLYWLSCFLPWPINTPLRLVQHGCLIVSHLCAYGVVRTLTRRQTFAVIVALSGLMNLGFTVLGNQLISESVYSAAASLTALLLCAYARQPRLHWLLSAGLAIGIAALVRATGIYMAGLPVALVAATIWQRRWRPEWPSASRQIFALAGCLGLVAACVAPVIHYNRTRLHFWGLTHYLGINLYARVIEYDSSYDPNGPAQRQILAWWEQRRARMGQAADPPAWRSHWSCAHLVMEEGGLNWAQADDLLRQAALDGIRKDPLGYARRTAKNLVDALTGDYRLYCYTQQDPPPADYPIDYFSGPLTSWAPYYFNKASVGSPRTARCFCMIDCYEPFGPPAIAALWDRVVNASLAEYAGVHWLQRLRWWAWLTIGGALISLALRPRVGWWLLFGLLVLHIVGAVAVEWPLPRYRLPFDMLLAVYPWLCVLGPAILLRSVAKRIISASTVTDAPAQPSLPAAA
jgi:hypothetical protein